MMYEQLSKSSGAQRRRFFFFLDIREKLWRKTVSLIMLKLQINIQSIK